MNRWHILLACVTGIVVVAVLGGGLNVIDDFTPYYSWHARRSAAEVDGSHPNQGDLRVAGGLRTTHPTFFITRYERFDPTRLHVFVRQGPTGAERTSVSVVLESAGHRRSRTFECDWVSPSPCAADIVGEAGRDATLTVAVTDYDRTGAQVGRATDVMTLKRRFRIGSRIWDTLLGI